MGKQAPKPAQLTGWLGNRIDSPVTIEVTDDLAREFMASPFYDAEYQMHRRMIPVWLASNAEQGGRNVAWENTPADLDAIDDLVMRVRAIEDGKEGNR